MTEPCLKSKIQNLKTEIIIGNRNAKRLSAKIQREHTSNHTKSVLTLQLQDQQQDLRQMRQEVRQLESES